jgi:mycofactocin system glycosyltransferase
VSATAGGFELDPDARRSDRGRLLVGGSPSRLVRLSDAGAAALDEALAGAPLGPAAAALAARLERGGLLHPRPSCGAGEVEIATVIPALDGGAALVSLVGALAPAGPVIVVDDGSADGSPERAAAAGARVVRNAGAPGPAGARNTGLRAATTELVAFLDADCIAAPAWRAGLGAMLVADPSLALVAPRVRSAPGPGALARYETRHSPLDLGGAPSLVGPGRRISYLPAAALVARRADLLAAGGFDEGLRYGEDVDLVWRLLASGHRARYVPAREVLHAPRPSLAGLLRQRAGYGGSAPALDRRHPGAAAPLRAGRHTAGAWLAGAALGPLGLAAGIATSAAIAYSHGSDRPARRALAGVALRGQATAGRHLARALTREWLPLTLAAATVSRRARRVAVAALLVDAFATSTGLDPGGLLATERDAGACLDPTPLLALRVLDSGAYAAGLWRAAIAERSPGALLPAAPSPPPE